MSLTAVLTTSRRSTITTLRAERHRLGLSQQQLAALVGDLDPSAVSLWEARRRRPTGRNVERLEAIFGRPLDDLLNDDGAGANADPANCPN